MAKARWVGFDLGGTKMLATVYDAAFRPLASERTRTKGTEGADAGLRRIRRAIETAVKDAECSIDQLQGIGVGCPGPLDLDRGILIDTPNLGWKDIPLKTSLEQWFACPAVVANDADVGVFGECQFGAAKEARCVLGVFPGTGIGGGCVYEGQIVRGGVGSCMEIGHVPVQPDGPLCGCGHHGCLEAVAGRLAIAAAAVQAAHRGHAPHLLKHAGTDLTDVRSGALSASIRAGDKVVEHIVRRAARQIGTAIAGVVNLLAPDVVVLGGGLVEAMPKLFLEEVDQGIRNRGLAALTEPLKVVASSLGDDAVVLGAAAWAKKVTSAEPAA